MISLDVAVEDTLEEVSLPSSGNYFSSLVEQAKNIQSLCVDYSVNEVSTENLRFDADTTRLVFRPDSSNYFNGTNVEPLQVSAEMSRYSMGQLCNKLGVPVRYVEKCLKSGRLDLAAENINSWVSDFNRNVFIRQYDNKIRGVLSDRYMTLDTPDILDVTSQVLNPDDYKIKGFFMSPERFHLRMVQEEMLNIEGEDLFAGIQIDSSDVGRSTLTVRFLIFKQVCTNGLIVSRGNGVLFEQRHVGIKVEEFRDDFRESMKLIPSLIETSVEAIMDSMKDGGKFSVNKFGSKDIEDFIDRLRGKTRLSEEHATKVIDMMKTKYTPTRWGLINSLTEIAQEFTLERRVEIEKIAGDMLIKAS